MVVYGDRSEFADVGERLASITRRLSRTSQMAGGLKRHSDLVAALIDAGQLQQGIEDAGGKCEALKCFVHRLGSEVVRSWDSGFGRTRALAELPKIEWRGGVELKLPEGFAFYAVYPEAYADAARKLRLAGLPRVVGMRSIGTTLGAVVAAALNAPVAITVRPTGDPFAREVELPRDILDDRSHYVIVDEGPGLSGSSFGSVADWLQRHGIPLERIAFVTSHAGDLGPQASEAHRRRWNKAQRVAAEFDSCVLLSRFAPLEEFSAGGAFERRKFIGRIGADRVLLKFAGLGAIGERKYAMARMLHARMFTAEPLGLVHGFLVQRWTDDAQPLGAKDKPVEEIGCYIGARARLFPARDRSGAPIEDLLFMCRRNISLAFGSADIPSYGTAARTKRIRRVKTDNKLDRGEWLRLPNGRLLKCDALDHHEAHDLIGCQSIEWDVAGAIEEFDLTPAEARRLIAAAGMRVDPELLDFSRLAYLAFRLGRADLGRDRDARDRYARSLDLLLHQDSYREKAQILV